MLISPDSVRPSPLWRRLAAMFYDAFLLLACVMVLGFVFFFINGGEAIVAGNPLLYALRTAIVATSLFFFAYFWSRQSQTLGMRAWQLVVVDEQGRSHIDMLAGIAVNSLGYGHPALVRSISEQAAKLGHTSNLFASAPALSVAGTLIQRFARDDAALAAATRVFFCNSGAEANEAAFKIARLTGRSRILAAVNGFHGRTMGALALTGQPDKRNPFAPLPTGVEFFPYGDAGYLAKLVAVNPKDVAAIVLEPIQGETGVIPAPEGFLAAARQLCDAHGILLIFDEVQTGVGRTGTFFAHQAEGVTPDVVTMAKGLGGGLPIGACLAHGPAKPSYQSPAQFPAPLE